MRKPVLPNTNNKGADNLRIRAAWSAPLLLAAQIVLYLNLLNFKPLGRLCSWAGLFESDLVSHPKDSFSRDEAHMLYGGY